VALGKVGWSIITGAVRQVIVSLTSTLHMLGSTRKPTKASDHAGQRGRAPQIIYLKRPFIG
jgi:hypothetical protein